MTTEDGIRRAMAEGRIVEKGVRLPALDTAPTVEKKRPSKYGNRKVEVDGITFDSKKEAERYVVLREMEKNGHIRGLKLQEWFRLEVNGQLVCFYVADFVYEMNGGLVVEDVKSEFTRKNPVYRIKKKLMKAVHGIEIQEV